MLRKAVRMLIRIVMSLALLTGVVLALSRVFVLLYAKPRTYTLESISPAPVAIVFGAGLNRDGSPTAVLRDRIATAVELYKAGKVKKLLMSGDNRFVNYNEPASMKQYALDLGVPEQDVVLDYAGRRTYDTCYRAKTIFGVKQAILITQNFHLPRALFTCNALGVQASGITADRRAYQRRAYTIWIIRELPATFVALWDVWFRKPQPVLGQPEPIFQENELSTNWQKR
jgi:SanA protein